MHIEFVRDKAKVAPSIADPTTVTSLKIWHCKFSSLTWLKGMQNLRSLCVATFPDPTLDALLDLEKLENLQVVHFPNATSLAPLAALRQLRSLELATLPSWDASYKRQVVQSLEPLANLPALESLHLLGVVPSDRSLAPLDSMRSLRSVKLLGYSRPETNRFLAAVGLAGAPSGA